MYLYFVLATLLQMNAKSHLPPRLLMMWHAHGGDFTCGVNLNNRKEVLPKSPLVDLSRRFDGHELYTSFIKELGMPRKRYLSCMLQAAVKDGSASMVKVELRQIVS